MNLCTKTARPLFGIIISNPLPTACTRVDAHLLLLQLIVELCLQGPSLHDTLLGSTAFIAEGDVDLEQSLAVTGGNGVTQS